MDAVVGICQLISLPIGVLYVLLAYPVLRRRQLSGYGVTLWIMSLALIVVWVVTGYRAGVYADEHQTGGNIFDNLVWLYMAVLLATGSLAKLGTPPKVKSHK